MATPPRTKITARPRHFRSAHFWISTAACFVVALAVLAAPYVSIVFSDTEPLIAIRYIPPKPKLNRVDYDARMLVLANNPPLATTTASTTPRLWPARAPYPEYGALLPFNRIIAYYGNFYSKQMGVLGEYPASEMLGKLMDEVGKWQAADPTTPVIPAIDYIAVTAQGSPGASGKYRFQMPDSQIDHALELANEVKGIVILDIQVGLSDLRHEIPEFEKYLKLPNVHLAIDPEFAMHGGAAPGTEIGTFDAKDVNYAANYLATLVKKYDLPPKILVVHRFTKAMVTHPELIEPLPEVQVVMDMDGWGPKARKYTTYAKVITEDPVQFAGLKLFYKNDLLPPSTGMLTKKESLNLHPIPIFIQYQ